jgi:hypothetical protein
MLIHLKCHATQHHRDFETLDILPVRPCPQEIMLRGSECYINPVFSIARFWNRHSKAGYIEALMAKPYVLLLQTQLNITDYTST